MGRLLTRHTNNIVRYRYMPVTATDTAEIHHRRSIRLQGYDYAQAGMYFLTICAHDHTCLFGEIVDGVMVLNDAGTIVRNAWTWLAEQYDYIALDECIVMPNHFHGILEIRDCRGSSRTAPTGEHKPAGHIPGT